MVIDADGRIYLGKDFYTDAATFCTMYSELDGWLRTKAKYDPSRAFTSNLGRRGAFLAQLQRQLSPNVRYGPFSERTSRSRYRWLYTAL